MLHEELSLEEREEARLLGAGKKRVKPHRVEGLRDIEERHEATSVRHKEDNVVSDEKEYSNASEKITFPFDE